ncbi:hypothetical protein NLI96_g5729 [Meripilus lineatus]|uniref:Exocyst complex component EXO84 n=1 Tax=Meripilus lineatus TaxID=2056292 RepID=A0AAD5YGN9_9APHY|nr:hypothetical protein NLI96_g5729 [Physisporinus lineatus]
MPSKGMQSLRTRKSSEPSAQRKLTKPKADTHNRKASRVDDKIRKRMSMRYADISSPTDLAIPAVPLLPIGITTAPQRGRQVFVDEPEELREDTRVTDLKLLDQDTFDPDAFLKTKLANSTEAELKSLQSSLHSLKDGVAQDLQRNVFKNYAEFVMVSKEISTMENEMLEFKDFLAEWKSMPSLLHIDDSASVAERRRNVRSSIADLRVLYANQMQTLHSQIEGSSKFVPTTPGRHIITEMDGIMSLNPATYKVDHSVKFVLLDDFVLVARRRRRRHNAENEKLIAERCWPLQETLVLDTKDAPSMTNVFKIRHNKETHVYRTEIAADKKSLLAQFRHVADELAAKKRKEREGEHQRRKSLWMAGDRTSMALPNDIPPMPDFLNDLLNRSEATTPNVKDKAEKDSRWTSEFTDKLTISIALRQWDKAITLVEEGDVKVSAVPGLAAKLTPLKQSLTTSLLQSLAMPGNRKSSVVHLITLLLRLKAGAAARSTFFTARSDVLRKCVRMIPFEGHIGMYIADLAIVVFTGIKHSADWFLASFKENEVASSFVEWAKHEVMNFAEMFRKQVYGPDVDPQVVEDAIKITHLQSKKLLEEYGLDFRFLLEDILVEKPPENARPPQFRGHALKRIDPIHTPSPTPIRARSPAPAPGTPIPSKSFRPRSPNPPPPVPPLPTRTVSPQGYPASSASLPPPSPVSRPSALRPGTPTTSEASSSSSRLARPLRGSPAPPPRSRDRPGSSAGHRPPPVSIPRRDGMF